MKIRRVVIVCFFVAGASAWGQAAGDSFGQYLLTTGQWDKAVQEFDSLAAKGGAEADAALYWKAYSLSKLGWRVEALAALDVLHKSHPMSRWLQDAAALEMEIKQAAGQSVPPESLSDEELKLLALNGLVQSDPERAVPAIESLLKQSHSQGLKREALYVVAQSSSPAAQKLMEQAARGNVIPDLQPPDLQVLAVRYLVLQKLYEGNLGQLLFEISNSTTNDRVQHEVLMGLATIGDVVHLSQIPTDVAQAAVANLPMFQQRLGLVNRPGAAASEGDYYLQQRDRAAKERIIDAWARLKVARSLIAFARVETDPELKKRIVEHLMELGTPEAKTYLLEIQK